MKFRKEHIESLWNALKGRPRPSSKRANRRPRNYQEILDQVRQGRDWDIVLGDFRHEFYLFRDESFFRVPPPDELPLRLRVFLTSMAEYLCDQFDLDLPVWVSESTLALEDEWDVGYEFVPGVEATLPERRKNTPEAFLKRNIVFNPAWLITL